MKVMLVYPNDRMDSLIPVGLSVLSAHLKAAGHDVKLYDTTYIDAGKKVGDFYRESLGQVIPVDLSKYGIKRIEMTPEELQQDFRKSVLDYKPGLIGFSTLEMTYDQGLELVNSIKDIKIPKIFGGIYPTFAPKIVLKEPSIDMICEGEGEEMLPELATALENNQDITNILNLTVKQNGKVYRSGEEMSLNDLPSGDDFYGEKTGLRRPQISLSNTLTPDYSIFDNRRFWKKMGGKAVRTVAVEMSRGCPFNCTFCCVPMQQYQHKIGREKFAKIKGLDLKLLVEKDPFHKEKPIDQFINELKDAIKKYDINYAFIVDESFLYMKPERFKEFVEKYSKLKLPFFTETRVETVKPGYAEDMEKAGCVGIALGVESGSPRVRREILNRMMNNDEIIRGFSEFEETSIRISANNIIGFPGETREDLMQTVEVNRYINPDSVIVNSFRPYSGTELRKRCIEQGLIPKEERVEDNRVYGAFNNGILSSKELEGIRKVFTFYVKFPKERWNEVREAENNDDVYEKLKKEFIEKDMLHRKRK